MSGRERHGGGRVAGALGGWLAALRIARREARRARGRTALVVAMVALPALGLSFAAATYDMVRLTPAERATQELGAAQAEVTWPYAGPVEQTPAADWVSSDAPERGAYAAADLLAALPPDSRAISHAQGEVRLRTRTGAGDLPARGLDIADPLTAGMVTVLTGRAPATDREVALTPQAAERLGAGLGDTVRVAAGGDPAAGPWTVTAIVEFPASLREEVVFRPAALPGADGGSPASRRWLVGTPRPVDWAEVERLNRRGLVVRSQTVLADLPDPADTATGLDDAQAAELADPGAARQLGMAVVAGGLAVAEVVLLAGAAFAVGARRRRRELALIGATGGEPAHLRRVVLADGAVVGALGAAVGLALGAATALAGRPLVEEYLVHQRAGGYRVFPLALLAIGALAVLTAMAAALLPALIAGRLDVLAALSGRPEPARSRRRWLLAGAAAVVVGAGAAAYGTWRAAEPPLLAGLVLVAAGVALCTPAAVGLLAGAAGRLPLAPRIALRDTARNRAAAAPAVSAVLAAVAGCVALGAYLDSADARRTAQHEASLPVGNLAVTGAGDAAVAPAARAALPVRAVVSIREVACGPAAENTVQMCAMVVLPERLRCPQIRLPQPLSRADQRAAARDPRCAGTPYSEILSARDVAGGPAVGPLTGATGADLDRAAAVLAAGGVVLADERYVRSGAVTIEYTRPTGAAGEVTVPAYVLRTASLPTSFIISPGALARLGLTARPSRVVIDTTRPPTQAELDSFRARLGEGASVFVERAPQGGNNPLLVLLGAVAGVIALGAAGIATGLAAADGRRDLATLAAVGASPGVRRLLSLSQAGAIAGLGTALGVVTGLVIAMAVLAALNQTQAVSWPSLPAYPLLVPWASLAVVVLGPLVAMLGAGLLTRSRLPVERRAG